MDSVAQVGRDDLLKEARGARASGDRQAALQAFESASILDPSDVGTRLEIATELRALNRASETEAIYRAILSGNDKQLSAMIGLAQIKSLQSDRNASLELFQHAETLAPDHFGVKLEIGRLLRELGRVEEAEAALGHLLEQKPQDVNAYVQLALLKRQQGDRQSSLDLFQTAATLDPERIGIQLEIANGLRELNRLEEAKVILDRVIERDPKNFGAHVGLGHISRRKGHRLTSLSHFEQVAKFNPKHTGLLLEIANDQRELGRLSESERTLETVVDLDPNHGHAHGQLGLLYRSQGQHQKALTAFEKAANCAPQNVWFQIELANCNRHAHSAVAHLKGKILEIDWKHAEAIKHYQAALDFSQSNAGAHWDLAKCHLLLFQPAVARNHLRQFVDLNTSARLLDGSSLNVSQNHIGQLIDEFLLDAELLSRLQHLTEIGSDPDSSKLFDLVGENPDHTPSAIALLLALRKRGMLRLDLSDGVGAGSRLIPRSIVQFWDDPAVSAEIARLTESWKDQNPGYAYRLFDQQSAGNFLRENYDSEVLAAFHRAEGPAQQADIFRLAYLARHGGFYADCDDRCLIALDRFIPATAAFVVFQEEYGTLGNNFIGVTPNHPVIKTAVALAVEAVNRGDRDIVWLSTGPGLLTRAFALTLAAGQKDELSRSAIFTVGQIQRFLGLHCPAAYKSTRRHWLRSSFGARQNARPPK